MVFQKIAYANRKIFSHINEILREYEINASDWRVIIYLERHQSSTFSPICEYYDMHKAMLSRTASKLESLGILSYLRSDDKREKYITLSTKGKEIFALANARIREYEEALLSSITQGKRLSLIQSLDIINKILSEQT